ncbi:LysR family transcriptional regulator [Bordetella bronchiseptica]|uniref:LysR family transcriptional regulator n=1 Tax=Bordetella bronchiseptica TaxID=518 RepID=UPI0004A0829C|nr:LysR family transcriptional regulator [Bordetella bronchiseptica]KDD32384.1 LysR substrate-binding domain protein [Bordetella bronchiseptica MBORD849]
MGKEKSRPLPNINLKLLHTFMLVAEHYSFRQAAELSHRSQAAVTGQIKQLEAQLGVDLFHRTTRQVRLTAEGTQLLESARRAVHEMENGLRQIQETVDLKRGRIFLSCSTTVSSTRLAPILAAFERDYPGVEVFVRELTSGDMFETVRREEADFGIGPIMELPEFDFEPILTENLYAVVPRNLFPDTAEQITLARLASMPLLLLNPGTALRALIDDTARSRGLTINTKFQFSQAQTLISMATAGLGAAVLPAMVLPAKPHKDVQVLPIASPRMTRDVAIVRLRHRKLTPAAARLAQLVRDLIHGPSGRRTARATTRRPPA